MRRGMGDRRLRPRFDVVGQLAGTLDASVSMALRDVGRGGAQVESLVQLPTGSLHRATFNCDGIEAAVQVCVRHVKPVFASTGEQRYLIGVEFVSPSAAVLELIERWLLIHGGESAFGAGELN
jgi:PilZ domain-containing protein